MDWFWLLVPASFVVGGFPTASLIGRFTGHNPNAEGSGNPGASNMYRVAGRRAGAAVLIGDMIKGFVPAALGTLADGRPLGVACGLAAMLGHIWPPTRRFKGGGKGVAALGGACWFLYPFVALACIALWAVLLRVVKMASVASLAMAALLPVGVAVRGRPGWEVGLMAAASIVIIIRHRSNIGRIARGEERVVERS